LNIEDSDVCDIIVAKIELPDSKNSKDNNYVIFECHFNARYVKYYPEMFINICTNFLTADE